VAEPDRLFGELVDIRCCLRAVSVTTQVVSAAGIDTDEQDITDMARFCGVIGKQRDQDDDGDTNHRDCNQEAADEQKARIHCQCPRFRKARLQPERSMPMFCKVTFARLKNIIFSVLH